MPKVWKCNMAPIKVEGLPQVLTWSLASGGAGHRPVGSPSFTRTIPRDMLQCIAGLQRALYFHPPEGARPFRSPRQPRLSGTRNL